MCSGHVLSTILCTDNNRGTRVQAPRPSSRTYVVDAALPRIRITSRQIWSHQYRNAVPRNTTWVHGDPAKILQGTSNYNTGQPQINGNCRKRNQMARRLEFGFTAQRNRRRLIRASPKLPPLRRRWRRFLPSTWYRSLLRCTISAR